MKIRKIIVICIAIIVPIAISILVGLYSYGYIGGWTKNQEKFVDYYYDEQKTSDDVLNTFVKFNSTSYNNHTTNVSLYKDYLNSDEHIYNETGTIKLDELSINLIVSIGDDKYSKYAYEMYFSKINNNNVDMNNVIVVLVETTKKYDIDLLKQTIEDYTSEFKNETLLDIYKPDLDIISKNNFFTNGGVLFDLNGTAKVTASGVEPRFIYQQRLGYTYAKNNTKIITSLSYCEFFVGELVYTDDDKPKDVNILCAGTIDNIKSTSEEYTSSFNMQEGFGLDTLKAIKLAGYTKYIMPTIILHSSIALLIMGALGVLFYFTYINEEKKRLNNNQNTNKEKKKSKH